MQKVRYEIDPYNRLILDGSGGPNGIRKFRQVLDGQFKTDEDNNLSYHVKTPLSKDEDIPNQIRLRGEWSLTDDHDLCLTLDKSARDTFGDRLTLQGEILDVNANSLLFAVTATAKEDTISTYVLNLDGVWKADEFNRISFHIKKEEGRYDILTFKGTWEINKNHDIIYQYERARLITKKRKTHTLTFKGYWDIKEKLRLSYVLSRDNNSAFNFQASAGIFKKDSIRYEIGIGLASRSEPAARTVTLYGKWNLKKDTGLVFEIEHGSSFRRSIVFGADVRLTGKDTVSFRLKNGIDNKDIGINLELSHKMLKGDGEVFLRALMSRKESAIYAGSAWRW